MKQERKHRARRWLAWTLILLVVIGYPLSIGPAFYFAWSSDSLGKLNAFSKVYKPILWLGDQSDRAKSAIRWYMRFWAPLIKTPANRSESPFNPEHASEKRSEASRPPLKTVPIP